MDPITILMGGISALGVGAQLFGGVDKYQAAQKQSAAEQQIFQTNIQQNEVRRQAMEVTAKRSQMETLRNNQQARAQATAAATASGSQFGSGLQGGLGQISGASGTNLLGINQNLAAGEQMFSLDNQINQQKMLISQAQAQGATGTGLQSLGSGILSGLTPMSNIFGQLFKGGNPTNVGSATGFEN